jgi:hypothetical protein
MAHAHASTSARGAHGAHTHTHTYTHSRTHTSKHRRRKLELQVVLPFTHDARAMPGRCGTSVRMQYTQVAWRIKKSVNIGVHRRRHTHAPAVQALAAVQGEHFVSALPLHAVLMNLPARKHTHHAMSRQKGCMRPPMAQSRARAHTHTHTNHTCTQNTHISSIACGHAAHTRHVGGVRAVAALELACEWRTHRSRAASSRVYALAHTRTSAAGRSAGYTRCVGRASARSAVAEGACGCHTGHAMPRQAGCMHLHQWGMHAHGQAHVRSTRGAHTRANNQPTNRPSWHECEMHATTLHVY